MERVHFSTLGCKLNQIESESLASAFLKAGFDVVGEDAPIPEGPDPALCVVNTCTVTGKAEQKSRALIRRLLRQWPGTAVLVTGCYAEVERDAIEALDPRVVAFPGSRKDELIALPDALNVTLSESPHASALEVARNFSRRPGRDVPAFTLSTDGFLFHSRASIKIQDGCDNACAYCRIRLARGRSVSLADDEVVERVRSIERAGWNEVVLTGVNLSQYRSSSGDFARLLERLLRETDRIALRISSLYPERVDADILDSLANLRVRPHFHLSIQSGSDRVLRAMRRPYGSDAILKAVELLRSVKDDPFLACDCITGFPGETVEDFASTLSVMETARFAWIHAFPFSPRPGTEAWSMRPRVPERVAAERSKRLAEQSERGLADYQARWVGREVEAIAEKHEGETSPGTRFLTENYLTVTVPGVSIRAGLSARIRILGPADAELVSG